MAKGKANRKSNRNSSKQNHSSSEIKEQSFDRSLLQELQIFVTDYPTLIKNPEIKKLVKKQEQKIEKKGEEGQEGIKITREMYILSQDKNVLQNIGLLIFANLQDISQFSDEKSWAQTNLNLYHRTKDNNFKGLIDDLMNKLYSKEDKEKCKLSIPSFLKNAKLTSQLEKNKKLPLNLIMNLNQSSSSHLELKEETQCLICMKKVNKEYILCIYEIESPKSASKEAKTQKSIIRSQKQSFYFELMCLILIILCIFAERMQSEDFIGGYRTLRDTIYDNFN